MKICFFKIPVQELGGGLENYFSQTASYFSKNYTGEFDIITLDKNTTQKLENFLQFYYFKKEKNFINKENIKQIKKSILPAKYFQAKNKKELITLFNKYDLIYCKNEILEALYLNFFVGFKNIPPVLFGVHTPLIYPLANSIHSKLHNLMYGGYLYKFVTRQVKAFHVLNSFDKKNIHRIHPKKITKLIHNPFDSKNFRNLSKKVSKQIIFNSTKINILWVGRFTDQKGVNDIKSIIEKINQSEYLEGKVDWNFVGEGEKKYIITSLSKKFTNIKYLVMFNTTKSLIYIRIVMFF
ncbi:glycosyltransferase family 4 protein [Candidatus Gracilibacteria bacterium]|nr:glycosyltransferase family 4 protein [Candidatus Gracilibacteria bacterium]